MKQHHLEQERTGGPKRHLEFDWEVVARCNPDYRRFAEAERERLGEQHPAWRTQYCLETVAGAGMLFSPQQRALMLGTHSRARMRTRELQGAIIAAGLDVGGEAMTAGREQDETVLTLLRVASPLGPSLKAWDRRETPEEGQSEASSPTPFPILGEAGNRLQILEQLAWRGCSHDALLAELTPLLARVWRPQTIAIDATGVGEGLASAIESRLRMLSPRTRVLRYRFTEQLKSRLGFGLLAAAGGRLTCYAGDGSAEYRELWTQIELCRVSYKPNRLMGFGVEPSRGHDDYIMSLALAVEAAALVQPPRVAQGRTRTED